MREENNQGNKRERDMKVLQTDRKVQDGKQEWYSKDLFPINISFLPLLHTNLKAMEPQKLLCDWSLEWPIPAYLTALWQKVGRRWVGEGQQRRKGQMEKMKTWSENGDQEEQREKGEEREKRTDKCGNREEDAGWRVWKEEEQCREAGMWYKEKQQPIETWGLFSLIPPPSVDLHLSHIHPINGLI